MQLDKVKKYKNNHQCCNNVITDQSMELQTGAIIYIERTLMIMLN